MSVQVSDLASVVRNAKAAIATAGDAASRLKGSAGRVVQRIAEVEAMVGELNDAESELASALGSTSNGGAPLDSGVITPAISPPVSPPVVSYVSPPVVTASTIAADRAAEAAALIAADIPSSIIAVQNANAQAS